MYLAAEPGYLSEPFTGERLSPTEIYRRVGARAGHLEAQGLVPGARVFLHNGNTAAFFIDLLAVWSLGGCAVPIDARLTPFEVATLASSARPKLALLGVDADAGLISALETSGARIVAPDACQGDAANLPSGRSHLDAPALILFTSGTTGDPKGVVHTHRSLRARWMSLRDNLGTAAYARTLCMLPTHFGHGLICNALFPWLAGNDLFITPPFRADIIVQLGALLDDHAITALSSVPTVWTLALRLSKPPGRQALSRVHIGSAPLTGDLWRRVQSWTGARDVLNTYGITETASWVAGPLPGAVEPEDGLVGRPWGATVKIVRADDPAEASLCAPGEAGMIWLNTPALMAGYFGRDDLTAGVVRDGWFKTGDIGFLDGDGALRLRGRERDEINKGGTKVYPNDIDGLAVQSPGVNDACAFAVDDPLYGQDVGLALVLDADASLEAVKSFLATRLARHQMPVRWYVVDAIPRTSRGKINRSEVARVCVDAERKA